MRDLQKEYTKALMMLETIGIKPIFDIKSVSTSRRNVIAWGRCVKHISSNTAEIQINPLIIRESTPYVQFMNVLVHEILHASVPDSRVNGGHDDKWFALANKVNEEYPELSIQQYGTSEEMNVSPDEHYKYAIKCSFCGKAYKGYNRMCRKVKYIQKFPEFIECTKCHKRGTVIAEEKY